jgi:hypothetical protein
MQYSNADLERIFRMAISNVEWARERIGRLITPDPDDSMLNAVASVEDAIHYLTRARDDWRAQLNTEKENDGRSNRSAG